MLTEVSVKMRNSILAMIFLLPATALANDHAETAHPEPAPRAEASEKKAGPVAAVEAKNARPLRANELIQSGGATMTFVDNNNIQIMLAPHSVAEFRDDGFHLLRGSASLQSKSEGTARTTSATLNFAGLVILSYDHKERSTSAFVLQGQGRMLNAHDDSQSLRLDRFRGATMVVGEVIPQLIRQLDVGSLDGWLKGYAWPEATRQAWLSEVPDGSLAVKPNVAKHLEEVKLENYFSAIDADDEVQEPDYYERKYADPDKTVAEANSVKEKSVSLKPEEAALISLPSTKIDLGFTMAPEVLTLKEKQSEVIPLPAKKANRSLASVKGPKPGSAKAAETVDPEISSVLNRLRSLQGQEAAVSPQLEFKPKASDTRGPASVNTDVVPDTVYDYSQNF